MCFFLRNVSYEFLFLTIFCYFLIAEVDLTFTLSWPLKWVRLACHGCQVTALGSIPFLWIASIRNFRWKTKNLSTRYSLNDSSATETTISTTRASASRPTFTRPDFADFRAPKIFWLLLTKTEKSLYRWFQSFVTFVSHYYHNISFDVEFKRVVTRNALLTNS